MLDFLESDLRNDTRLVEVGGGTGRITYKLVDGVSRLTVIDLSRRMLERNKLRLGTKANWVQYIEGFAQECLNPSSFDVVLASLVLVHNVDDRDFENLVRAMCCARKSCCALRGYYTESTNKSENEDPATRTDFKRIQEVRFSLTREMPFRLFSDEIWLARFAGDVGG